MANRGHPNRCSLERLEQTLGRGLTTLQRINLHSRHDTSGDGWTHAQPLALSGEVDGILSSGDQVQLHVDGGCPRCVVTTLAQANLPEEMGNLRATARHNNLTAGVQLSVLAPGLIKVNDPVGWQSS